MSDLATIDLTESASRPVRGKYTFAQFTAIRRYQPALSFSPDGSEIAYSTNTSGQFNLWKQPSAGGYPKQMTIFTENAVREIAWSPDGKQILFTADHHGDEFTQLYLIPANGGRPQPLTAKPQVQHHLGDHAWSPDGRTIAYSGNDRNPADSDVILRDVQGSETGRPLFGDGYYQPIEWAPGGTQLTAIKARSNTDQDLILVDLVSGEKREFLQNEDAVQRYPGPWALDGSGFYVGTDLGREFLGLGFIDVETGDLRWIETPDWNIEGFDLSSDGRYLAWIVNEGGYSRLHVRDLTTGNLLPLPELPEGVIGTMTISPDGSKIGMLLVRPQHPAEIYVIDLASQMLTQLTDGALGGVDEADLVRPELVTYRSFDGHDIPAFLYKPIGIEKGGTFPVVLSIHGGPEAQERPTYAYSGLYQYLTSVGIGVLAPNIRGSTGYGKTYQTLIHRKWGETDLEDFRSSAEYLKSLDWVDSERMGVYGGSYGGFATLTCVTRLPDYWAAAVDIVGPANLVTFAKAVPPTWRRFMDTWVGNPETEVDFLMERSPITYVDQVTAPLFVIQGAQDPRVVKSESDQIVERLRARNVTVRYDVYEDEGHGFTKRENELKSMTDIVEFFEEHLLDGR